MMHGKEQSSFDWLRWKSLFSRTKKPSRVTPRVAVILSNDTNKWALEAWQSICFHFYESALPTEVIPRFELYCAYGDTEYLNQKILTPLLHAHQNGFHYDAIVSINTCSKDVQAFLDLHESDIPHIFCGVKDPVGAGLVRAVDRPGKNTTGVTGLGHNYKRQVGMLKAIKPSIKTALILQNTEGMIEGTVPDDRKKLTEQLEQHSVEVTLKKITHTLPIADQVGEIIPNYDVICTLRDIVNYGQISELSRLCSKYFIPLYSSELSSVHTVHGASIGYGDNGKPYGEETAIILNNLLYSDLRLRNTPVFLLNTPGSLEVNKSLLGIQGVHIDKRTLVLMENTQTL